MIATEIKLVRTQYLLWSVIEFDQPSQAFQIATEIKLVQTIKLVIGCDQVLLQSDDSISDQTSHRV